MILSCGLSINGILKVHGIDASLTAIAIAKQQELKGEKIIYFIYVKIGRAS